MSQTEPGARGDLSALHPDETIEVCGNAGDSSIAGRCGCVLHEQLSAGQSPGELNFTAELRSDLQAIAPFVDGLTQRVQRVFDDEGLALRVSGATSEALINAVVHGNLEVASALKENEDPLLFSRTVQARACEEPYCQRIVRVNVSCSSSELKICICDEGPGFNPNSVADPTDIENLELPSGRGLLMMRAFMDDVQFNDKGNEVWMIKRVPGRVSRSISEPAGQGVG